MQIFKLLQLYEEALGQKLNAAKTTILFSKNTGEAFKEHLCSLVGVAAIKGNDKYLGLPALVGRSKLKVFPAIQGRVQKFLDGWKEKFLSQAGKEILLKVVIQAIPAYTMSIFLLPKKLCNSLNAMISWFW